MNRPSVICRRVNGVLDDLGAEHPGKYRQAEPLPLLQWWENPGRVPHEQGVAYAGCSAHGLCFYVYLEDGDIYTQAQRDNEKLWLLGDVVEFFIKAGEDCQDYWEIHVAPNDLMMTVHIPMRASYLAGEISWDDVLITDSGCTKRVQVVAAGDGWAVELCIPWAVFGCEDAPHPGAVWQFAVCRYNYATALADLEYSSTAQLIALNYHQYEEYTDLVF